MIRAILQEFLERERERFRQELQLVNERISVVSAENKWLVKLTKKYASKSAGNVDVAPGDRMTINLKRIRDNEEILIYLNTTKTWLERKLGIVQGIVK